MVLSLWRPIQRRRELKCLTASSEARSARRTQSRNWRHCHDSPYGSCPCPHRTESLLPVLAAALSSLAVASSGGSPALAHSFCCVSYVLVKSVSRSFHRMADRGGFDGRAC